MRPAVPAPVGSPACPTTRFLCPLRHNGGGFVHETAFGCNWPESAYDPTSVRAERSRNPLEGTAIKCPSTGSERTEYPFPASALPRRGGACFAQGERLWLFQKLALPHLRRDLLRSERTVDFILKPEDVYHGSARDCWSNMLLCGWHTRVCRYQFELVGHVRVATHSIDPILLDTTDAIVVPSAHCPSARNVAVSGGAIQFQVVKLNQRSCVAMFDLMNVKSIIVVVELIREDVPGATERHGL